jgi:hypothetical protein
MDLNVRAFRTVQAALEELSPEVKRKKEASRRGGLAGGKSRSKALSAQRKKEIALAANAARWSPKTPAESKRVEEER